MNTIWVIALLNVFAQPQATLTGADGKVLTFPTLNACQNEMISRGLADFKPFGVHGKCQRVSVLENGQLRAVR